MLNWCKTIYKWNLYKTLFDKGIKQNRDAYEECMLSNILYSEYT